MKQEKQEEKLLHAELTRSIIGCAFEVINELGSGFLESVYEKAMMIALSDAGLSVQSQKPVKVLFRGKPVGDFYADLVVEEKVMVELKSVKTLIPEHEAQTINYLNATGIQGRTAHQLRQTRARIQTLHPKQRGCPGIQASCLQKKSCTSMLIRTCSANSPVNPVHQRESEIYACSTPKLKATSGCWAQRAPATGRINREGPKIEHGCTGCTG